MTKLQQMLTSLVAALPAAFLLFQLVRAMLLYSGDLSTVAYVVMGLTLLSAAAVALIPAAVMVAGNKKPVPEKAVSKPSESGEEIETLNDDVALNDESSGSFDSSSSAFESGDSLANTSDFDLGGSSDDVLADLSDDEIHTEALDEFDLGDDDEEEPKSKKKKH